MKTNATLTSLNLGGNKVGDDGARALAEAMKTNATLTSLDLGWNEVGADGARAVEEIKARLAENKNNANSIEKDNKNRMQQGTESAQAESSTAINDGGLGARNDAPARGPQSPARVEAHVLHTFARRAQPWLAAVVEPAHLPDDGGDNLTSSPSFHLLSRTAAFLCPTDHRAAPQADSDSLSGLVPAAADIGALRAAHKEWLSCQQRVAESKGDTKPAQTSPRAERDSARAEKVPACASTIDARNAAANRLCALTGRVGEAADAFASRLVPERKLQDDRQVDRVIAAVAQDLATAEAELDALVEPILVLDEPVQVVDQNDGPSEGGGDGGDALSAPASCPSVGDMRKLAEEARAELSNWRAKIDARIAGAVEARAAAAEDARAAAQSLVDALARLRSAGEADADEIMQQLETQQACVNAALESVLVARAAETSTRDCAVSDAASSFPLDSMRRAVDALRAFVSDMRRRVSALSRLLPEMRRLCAMIREQAPAAIEQRARDLYDRFQDGYRPLRRRIRQASFKLEELEDDGADASKISAARAEVRGARKALRRLHAERDEEAFRLVLLARETAPELLWPMSTSKEHSKGGGRDEAWREPLARMGGSGGLAWSGLDLDAFDNVRVLEAAADMSGAAGPASGGPSRHRVRVGELDGKRYALKEYAAHDARTMMRECARLQALRHPCIAELSGIVVGKHHAHLQMPYYEGGTVASLVRCELVRDVDSPAQLAARRGTLASQPDRLRLLARQLLLGLDHMHRVGVLHCDIKPSNLFLGGAAGEQLRIGDFDVSRDGEARSAHATVVAATTIAPGGLTVAYCAPEIMPPATGRATSKSDMYSAGLVLLDLRFPPGTRAHDTLRPRPRGAFGGSTASVKAADVVREMEAEGASFVDRDLARLIASLLQRDPSRRPSAGEAMAHEYFVRGEAAAAEALRAAAEADEARLGGVRTCAICLDDDVREAHGVACPQGNEAHFVCDSCFSAKVRSDSDRASEQNGFMRREGRVYCVGYTVAEAAHDALQSACCRRAAGPAPYDEATIASHAEPAAFAAYLGGREEVLRAELGREADAKVREELERLLRMDERARRIEASVRHVRDNILTLRCPNPNGQCGQAFVDFEGCFALACSRCNGRFCAWCLEWCGFGDAHPHVRQCAHKPAGADAYFGSEAEFEASNRARRQRDLARYVATLDDDTRAGLLHAVRRDLADLGLRAGGHEDQ